MKTNEANFTGNYIKEIGYPEGKVNGIVLEVINQHFNESSPEEVGNILINVLSHPEAFINHQKLAPIANELLKPLNTVLPLKDTPNPYKVYGTDGIEQGAIQQMEMAMRLPIVKAGALMPDAHHGYGLPIGGVLATENAVIPYGVGVDIGCRMCMTIYDIPPNILEDRNEYLKKMLISNTKFGKATFKKPKIMKSWETVFSMRLKL